MEWVSVYERLPEFEQSVLVWSTSWCADNPGIGRFHEPWDYEEGPFWLVDCTSEGKGGSRDDGVTHWMPLPNGPTEHKQPTDQEPTVD
jgi:hypothetical protein